LALEGNTALYLIAIIVAIKLVILAAVIIRYRVRNHWQKVVFKIKVTLAIMGIIAGVIFGFWRYFLL
jgi:ABC-type phosphate transport system permease subunit